MDRDDVQPVTAPAAPVPGSDHYRSNYLGSTAERLCSYRHQVAYTLRSRPSTVLIVGRGDGLVETIVTRAGIRVCTLDIALELRPDIVASVVEIPASTGSFDVAVCCQVLEHLPFEDFTKALSELRRVTRGRLVLSLPDVRRMVHCRLRLPKVHVDWQCSIPRIPAPRLPDARRSVHGHHWEIGFRGTGYQEVRRSIVESGWLIQEVRRVDDLPWHTFFYCEAA